MMDELEQKCHDLEFKARRLEEERNETLHENEDLQEQIDVLRSQVESHHEKPDHLESDILRMSEEIVRLDGVLAEMNQSLTSTTEKLKEVNDLKEALRTMGDETTGIKEDFLHLKNHLNLAAKIELQTNEKMYENRLHHLEKMLEEMRHREESFLHIAEETNILKDQVDSLRELSLATIKNDQEEHHHQLQHQHQQPHARLALATSAAAAQPDSCNKTLSLDTELLLGRAALREDSPPTDDINMEGYKSHSHIITTPESDCPSQDFYIPSSSAPTAAEVMTNLEVIPADPAAAVSPAPLPGTPVSRATISSPNNVFRITGQVKLQNNNNVSIVESSPERWGGGSGTLHSNNNNHNDSCSSRDALNQEAHGHDTAPINCCSKLFAKFWLSLFDG